MDKEEKLDFFSKLAESIKPQGKIVYSGVSANFEKQEKYYANTEGSYYHSVVYNSDPSMSVAAAMAKRCRAALGRDTWAREEPVSSSFTNTNL